MKNALEYQKADHPIEPLLLRRWSPREREAPSDRKPVSELICEGVFRF
jgi:hypothetical protein